LTLDILKIVCQQAKQKEKSTEMEMAFEFEEHCHQNILRMANIFDLFLIRDNFLLDVLVLVVVVAGFDFGRFA